jgi:hypothetical protein
LLLYSLSVILRWVFRAKNLGGWRFYISKQKTVELIPQKNYLAIQYLKGKPMTLTPGKINGIKKLADGRGVIAAKRG